MMPLVPADRLLLRNCGSHLDCKEEEWSSYDTANGMGGLRAWVQGQTVHGLAVEILSWDKVSQKAGPWTTTTEEGLGENA